VTINSELFDPNLLEPRLNAFIPHMPTPRQAAFLMLDCQEAFYGGAGGGGKSDALLMAALQYADVPGYNALIIRRNMPDLALPNALIDRAHSWLRGRQDACWNEQKKQWKFSSGATLTFGYLEGARDADRYASAEFHFIGVDELTQFAEKQYLDLFARARSGLPALRIRARVREASRATPAPSEGLRRVHRPATRQGPFVQGLPSGCRAYPATNALRLEPRQCWPRLGKAPIRYAARSPNR
jgi:Terminase large subunit, T4likevirus-type, N-terminal